MLYTFNIELYNFLSEFISLKTLHFNRLNYETQKRAYTKKRFKIKNAFIVFVNISNFSL